MSNFIIALLFSLGASTWIYTKLMRSTGSNTRNSIVAAVCSGLLMFLVFYFVLEKFISQ